VNPSPSQSNQGSVFAKGPPFPDGSEPFRLVRRMVPSQAPGAWVCRAAYILMAVSLAAALVLNAGVVPAQFGWSAIGVSLAACLALARAPRANRATVILTLLLGWMLFQLVPLPAAWVAVLSPYRYHALEAARTALGHDPSAWMPLSAAPAATLTGLLFVVPAMAAFLAAGEMARWWAGRMWLVAAPVIALAWLEALLGLVQFFLMRMAGGAAASVSGTYSSYDHFAGLLEMAFPLAVMGALHSRDPLGRIPAAVRTAAMLAAAACLLMGIILSLSRMGVLATLAAFAGVLAALAFSLPHRRRWVWLIPAAVPLLILVSLSTRELLLRFADLTATPDISKDARVEAWSDTLHVIAAYPWTGCGLGAYERGMYRFKNAVPTRTLDYAHNDYLQMAAELGIPGILLLAALAVWVLSRTLRVVIFMRGSPNWALACGLLGALLAIAVHSLADFNLYVPANALAFAWLAGLSAGLAPGPERRTA
jgi:O-antigen ligase